MKDDGRRLPAPDSFKSYLSIRPNNKKMKIWHYVGMSKNDLLAMKAQIEEQIKKRAAEDHAASASTNVSQTFDHAILGERLAAVNYALKKQKD